MATQPNTFITPEQYLEIERQAEFKSEYYNGEMFAMSGAMFSHNQIVVNVSAQLYQQLRNGRCQHCTNDMRVRVTPKAYAYPDAAIVCGEPQFLDNTQDSLLNPSVIIEVLSPSTERCDRGRSSRSIAPSDPSPTICCCLPTRRARNCSRGSRRARGVSPPHPTRKIESSCQRWASYSNSATCTRGSISPRPSKAPLQ